MTLICTKSSPDRCTNRAVCVLLVQGLTKNWEAHPRCADHPAQDDIALAASLGLPAPEWTVIPLPEEIPT